MMQRRITIPLIALGLLLGPRVALAQVTLTWAKILNGTAHARDRALSMAVDHEGNVLAAGVISNTGTGGDFAVVKFAPDGTLLWQQTLNGTANAADSANSVAVDHEGNVLAAGVISNTGTGSDFTVVKFAGDGTLLWQQTLTGPSNAADSANSVVVDHEGNVFAAGTKGNQRTSGDFTVAKFAGDGTLLWQQALDGTLHFTDEATSVVVDHEGNVLAVGDLNNSTTADDITVAKFAGGDGTLLWRQILNGTANAFDHATSVAVDTEGNVLAAGTIDNTNTRFDFLVAKFAAGDGTLLWRQTLNGTAANPIDSANSVAVDHEGNVLAAGTIRNQFPNTNVAFTVVKFAADGTLLWRQALRGTSTSFGGSANSVIVDSEGNVIAAGTINNQRTVDDFTVAKFTGDGTLLWQQTLAAFNDLLSASDAANSVAVDHEGNVLAAGVIQNLSYDDDFTVAKFGTDWTFCAPEGGICAFTGTTEVRYGAIGSFVVKTLADGTACINDVFGDPIYGNVKECATRTTPRTTEWTFCANEGDTCAFTGPSAVRYGANGAFFFKTLTDGTACTNDAFGGDPIYGTVKQCAIPSPPQPEWTFCAPENGVCAFTGTREVRYGANGSYVYQTRTDGTACTNEVFGDPIYGVVKSCDLRSPSGSPPQP